MNHSYSNGFQELISNEEELKDLLLNCSFSGTFKAWEKRKSFITKAINKDGSFLDVGCGNGFLLRCLQEWSEHSIAPYGIDISEKYTQKAKELFAEYADHFAVLDVNKIKKISEHLPVKYDFVFISNVWSLDNSRKDLELIEDLQGLVKSGGRLILGFYSQEKKENLKVISWLVNEGVAFSEVIENPQGTNMVAYIATK